MDGIDWFVYIICAVAGITLELLNEAPGEDKYQMVQIVDPAEMNENLRKKDLEAVAYSCDEDMHGMAIKLGMQPWIANPPRIFGLGCPKFRPPYLRPYLRIDIITFLLEGLDPYLRTFLGQNARIFDFNVVGLPVEPVSSKLQPSSGKLEDTGRGDNPCFPLAGSD